MTSRVLSAITIILAILCTSYAFAGGGTLKGKFIYGGDAPKPEAIAVTADKAFCGKKPLFDEKVVVSENDGLANVIIYLY